MEDKLQMIIDRLDVLIQRIGNAPVPPPELPIAHPPGETPEEYYLRVNTDVRDHPVYGKAPKLHWDTYGIHEPNRASMWPRPVMFPTADDMAKDQVETPRGRWFPRPRPDIGEMFMAYTVRVGASQSEEAKRLAINVQGTLRDAAVPLFEKHGGYRPDGSNWPAAAEDWLFPIPTEPDPGWENIGKGTR